MKVYSKVLDEPSVQLRVLDESVERVLQKATALAKSARDDELHQDLMNVSGILIRLWNEARNSIHMLQLHRDGDPLGLALITNAEKECASCAMDSIVGGKNDT